MAHPNHLSNVLSVICFNFSFNVPSRWTCVFLSEQKNTLCPVARVRDSRAGQLLSAVFCWAIDETTATAITAYEC